MSSPNRSYSDQNSLGGELGAGGVEEHLLRSPHASPKVPITRTVAIIKHHALQHRFDIERRIQEANFEIVKERQMEFDTETDPDTLEELFGEDANSLAEGPVWVYVLERRRAVEVWHTLMGHWDPDFARQESPNSLRALYGISSTHNGLMGSPDNQTAEVQIAALFASSPPFPTTELPSDDGRFDSMRSATGASVLEALRQQGMSDEGYVASNGYAPSSATNPSTVGGSPNSRLNANGKAAFRARPIPTTLFKPDIAPRTTKAALLRAGLGVDKSSEGPRRPVTKERLAETFANVPGHKRAESIAVASTAAPTIAPRMTRAASLRLGIVPPPAAVKKAHSTDEATLKSKAAQTFEGVPGHKRRESISVASVKPPTVAPRLNKSASLRTGPPTAFKTPPMGKPPVSRSTSSDNLRSTSRPPSTAPIPPTPTRRPSSTAPTPVRTRPASQTSHRNAALAALTNTPSASAVRPGPRASSVAGMRSTGDVDGVSASARKPRPSSIACPPTIAPKTNRSAALRAAKQEAEQAAAAAALAKKSGRVRLPPSSFKAVAV